MWKNLLIGGVLTGLVVGLALKQRALRALRSELAQITKGSVSNSTIPAEPPTSIVIATPKSVGLESDNNPSDQRLTLLEEQVRQLTAASELLMVKGQLPLSEDMAARLKRKFLDASLPDRERLEALRALRRHNAVDDEILQAGLTWIDALSDPRLMREVLEQFIGLKQPALRDKLFQLVATHPDDQLRQRAVQGLAKMMDDPAVESAVWKALTSEQNAGVQRELEEALLESPMTPARQTELQRRTLDSEASFQERLTAFQAMASAKVVNAQTTAVFTDDVVAQNRVEDMAVLFRALDNTGNVAAAPALIKGLQTTNPEIRMLALDALSEMQSDADVVKWLQYTANNDADERVRAEAVRVLAQANNKPR